MAETQSGAGDRSLLRRMNSDAVLAAVKRRASTATELATDLGISRTAIEDVLRDLLSLGWISSTDDAEGASKPGRPAKRFTFNATAGYVAGADIGVHSVTAKVADLSGRTVGFVRREVEADLPTDTRLSAAAAACREAMTRAQVDAETVWTIGVGIPGVVDASGVVRRYGGDGMPGWAGTDIRSQFSRLLGTEVVVESDNTLAAIAEHWQGVASTARDVVFILSGNRTSAGLLIGGEPHRGASGGAGLVGVLPELGWASAPSYIARLATIGVDPSREGLFAAAEHGNPEAAKLLDEFAAALAKGIAAMALAVDPELIVLGGGISQSGDAILNPVTAHLRDFMGEGAPPVRLSSLGSDATSIGAVKRALSQVEENLASLSRSGSRFPTPSELSGTPS